MEDLAQYNGWPEKMQEGDVKQAKSLWQMELTEHNGDTLQNTFLGKKRNIQHLEAVKGLNAAWVKMQVYDQEKAIQEEWKRPENVSHKRSCDHLLEIKYSRVCKTAGSPFKCKQNIRSWTFGGAPLKYRNWKLSFLKHWSSQ